MAISNSFGGFTYRVNQMIEDAALDAGIPAQLLTAEMLQRMMRTLNVMLQEMPNLRIFTWQQQRIIIPIYEATSAVPAPTGTFNLLDRNCRQPTRLTDGVLTSSDGGTVAFATDDDFETKLTQVSPNGNLRIAFTNATQVFEFGILWGAAGTYGYVTERSDDAVSWLQVGDANLVTVADREWTWTVPDGNIASLYWRIRLTNGTMLSAREVYFGGIYRDVPFGPLSRTQYSQMVNRSTPGQPLQAFLDRQRDVPIMYVWPPASRAFRYYHVAAYQQRQIADVLTLRETIDVPQRWYSAVVKQLAVRICERFEEAKKDRLEDLRGQLAGVTMPAVSEDRDGAPIIIQPDIRAYT